MVPCTLGLRSRHDKGFPNSFVLSLVLTQFAEYLKDPWPHFPIPHSSLTYLYHALRAQLSYTVTIASVIKAHYIVA